MGFWDSFHAGVAGGLAGNTAQAHRFFGEIAGTDDQRDWAQAAAALAREYSLALEALPDFRLRIDAVIRRAQSGCDFRGSLTSYWSERVAAKPGAASESGGM